MIRNFKKQRIKKIQHILLFKVTFLVNFQESTTILNAFTKKSGNLLNAPRKMGCPEDNIKMHPLMDLCFQSAEKFGVTHVFLLLDPLECHPLVLILLFTFFQFYSVVSRDS